MNSEYNNWNEEHTVMILDGPIVRPAPTPKRIGLTPEELARIERRVEALRPRPLTEQEKAKLAHIKRCS